MEGVTNEIGDTMWKLSYTYKEFVGIKTEMYKFFKTKKSLNNYLKVHPTVDVILCERINENENIETHNR